MKASELRPCDGCGHPLTGRPGGMRTIQFYAVSVDRVLLDHAALNQVLGLHQIFHGKALGLAEMFAPDPEVAKSLGHPTQLLLCFDCYATGSRSLAAHVELRNEVRDGQQSAAAGDTP